MDNGNTLNAKSKTKEKQIKSNSNQPNDFKIIAPITEYQDDDYEKILEKEIEDQCEFKAYVNKLELEDKTEEELLLLTPKDILEFKNNQIEKLKAYIASLEQEKDDLIENFKNTTSILLERIKDYEFQQKGFRPETPMIAKNLAKKTRGVTQNDFKSLSNYSNNNNNQITNKANNTKTKTIERCPNCHLQFSPDEFLPHSLQCLRKAFNCKACNELVNENNKVEHLNKYRSPEAILKSIKDNNVKALQLGIAHGYQINTIIDSENQEAVIHIIARSTNNIELMDIVLKHKSVNANLVNKNKETALILAIENKNESIALMLLDKRVDFNIRNKGDMSPLMLSCKYGLGNAINKLLALGVDINERNILGDTPLAIALRHNHNELEMMFLERKDLSIKPLKKKNI